MIQLGTEATGVVAADVERIVVAWLGSPAELDSAELMTGGGYNTTLALRVGGERVILRIAPAREHERPSEVGMMRNEWAAIPFLRPVAELMPRTLLADFTHQVIDRDYLIQSFLPGARAREVIKTWRPADVTTFWHSLGEVLAEVHTVTSAEFGRIIGPHHRSWSGAVAANFLAVADGCDELGLDAADLRQLADISVQTRGLLDQVEVAHLLHGDLTPGNVMVDPDHPERGVIGIFDCDRVWWGDPAADWTVQAVERLESQQAAGFWAGYGLNLVSDGPARRRRLLYRAYALGEARLEHLRLGRRDLALATYDAATELIESFLAFPPDPA